MIKLLYPKFKILQVTNIPQCCFHRNAPMLKHNSFLKQSKILSKILSANTVKRKRVYAKNAAGELVNVNSLSNHSGGAGKNALRRIAVLNKLFMRNITDLLTTGEVANQIGGHRIEISEVCVTPDFKRVNIFWISKSEVDEAEKEKLLERVAITLRHELHRRNVIGLIPHLVFVPDKKAGSLLALDVQLAKADFGEDFVPTDATFQFKSEFYLNLPLEPEIAEKIKKLELNSEIEESPLPLMRHDVFGLDHDSMIKSIAASIGKSRDAWNKSQLVFEMKRDPNSTAIFDDGVDISRKEEKEIFTKFLKKRQILQKKAIEELKGKTDERILIEDNSPDYERLRNSLEDFDDEEFDNYFNEENIKL